MEKLIRQQASSLPKAPFFNFNLSLFIMTADSKRESIERKPEDNFVEMSPVEKGGVLGDAEADYSGAVKKTDPAEIRLVRKLDYRIMPTLWAMYFLNYVSLMLEMVVYSAD
jgi:hypothetical protein